MNKPVHRRSFGSFEVRVTTSAPGHAALAVWRNDLDRPIAAWNLPLTQCAAFATAMGDAIRDLIQASTKSKPAVHAGDDSEQATPSPTGDTP